MLLLKVTEVTTNHQKITQIWFKIDIKKALFLLEGQNKNLGQRPKPCAGARKKLGQWAVPSSHIDNTLIYNTLKIEHHT